MSFADTVETIARRVHSYSPHAGRVMMVNLAEAKVLLEGIRKLEAAVGFYACDHNWKHDADDHPCTIESAIAVNDSGTRARAVIKALEEP